MHIFVAIPTSRGAVEIECLVSLFKLQKHLATRRTNVETSLSWVLGFPTDEARNILSTKFMAHSTATHLLFVDDDMGFEPRLIDKLLDEDKPVTAAFCPSRFFSHEAASTLQSVPHEKRMSVSADYVASRKIIHNEGKFEVTTSGFVQVSAIGTGVMLIRKEVFNAIGADQSLWKPPGDRRYAKVFNGPVLQSFARLLSDDGTWLSEDLSFCRRWTDLSGEIWACVDEEITHVGRIAVRGMLRDQLDHFGGLPPQAPS